MNAKAHQKTKAVSKWQVTLIPFSGIKEEELAALAGQCYREDSGKLGKAIMCCIDRNYPEAGRFFKNARIKNVPCNPRTGLRGANIDGDIVRMGSVDAVHCYFLALGHAFPDEYIWMNNAASEEQTEILVRNGEIIGAVKAVPEHSMVSEKKMRKWPGALSA